MDQNFNLRELLLPESATGLEDNGDRNNTTNTGSKMALR